MGIIEFNDVSFTYDGTHRALDGISLDIRPGEFVCILGGNGSGKSTLAKHVNALLVPDEGAVCVLGADTADPAQTFFVRSHAGMVFQNPDDQLVASVIEDDVAFGPENLGLPTAEIRDRVTAALAQVGLQGFERRETAALSGGQKQRVAIAGVLAMNPEILVLDEASAMLDPRGRTGLLRVCRELNDAGLTIVLITHFMEEAALADRVIVLDGGHIAAAGTPAQVLTDVELLESLALDIPFAVKMSRDLQQRGVPVVTHVKPEALEAHLIELLGAVPDASDEAPRSATSPSARTLRSSPMFEDECVQRVSSGASKPATAPLVRFEHVSYTYQPPAKHTPTTDAQPDWGNDPNSYWALHDVTFSLEQGNFLGIAGHTGSGKSTLIQLANGLLQPTAGTVTVKGHDLASKHAAAEARRDVGVVFQYPEHQLFAATVREDVAFGPRNLGLSGDELEERVRGALALVHLDYDELADKSPFALSGGQQRRVAFAGVLAMKPSLLMLDEPTAGLDPRSHDDFLRLIAELHDEKGLSVAVVSHNMDDLALLCNRLLVLNQGTVFAQGTPDEVFSREADLHAIGLAVPAPVQLANALTSAGVPIATPRGGALFTRATLANALATAFQQASGR